jgi:hypothetical protein
MTIARHFALVDILHSSFTDSSRKTTKKRKKSTGKSEGSKAFEKELTDTSRKALSEFRSL